MAGLRHVALIYDAKSPYSVKVMAGGRFLPARGRPVEHLHSRKNRFAINGFRISATGRETASSRISIIRGWPVRCTPRGSPRWRSAADMAGTTRRCASRYFFPNNRAIARLAAEHLLERGFRHFAYYGYPPSKIDGWSNERADEFKRCVTRAGGSFSLVPGSELDGTPMEYPVPIALPVVAVAAQAGGLVGRPRSTRSPGPRSLQGRRPARAGGGGRGSGWTTTNCSVS